MADRFEEYRGDMKALLAYREAYIVAASRDPASVEDLPDPGTFDPVEAKARLDAVVARAAKTEG